METASASVRVIIADDSTPVRERFAALLREIPQVEVVAETGDVAGSIAGVRDLRPDILCLDICMPGGSGLDVLDYIRAERIPTRTVVLTNLTESEYRTRALLAGAVVFLNKTRDFLKAAEFVRDYAQWKAHTPKAS